MKNIDVWEVLDDELELYHLDDMIASQYQSIDWTQLATCQSSISWGTFWFQVLCLRKLLTRPALTWTTVPTISMSH